MPSTKIFVGSSAASKTQAKLLIKGLATPTVTFLPWWNSFTAGRTLLEELDSIKKEVDGALLLFTPEFPATIRSNTVAIPNQTVLFEFAYF